MRISDWSSDVCSSDLLRWEAGDVAEVGPRAVAGNAATDAEGTPLPSREYSIASVPGDGSLQLIVRRMFRPDGRPGLGSGWLLGGVDVGGAVDLRVRSEEHTSELQSLMRISYAVFCLQKKN